MPEPIDETVVKGGDASAAMIAEAFSRRTLMASVIGGISIVALASRFAGQLSGDSNGSGLAQTSSPGPASVGSGSPSPIASPIASPSPTATATATPSPTPVPDPFGDIELIRGEQFEYDGEPAASDTLSLFVQGTDQNFNFSPTAFAQDPQILAAYLDPLVGIDKVTMEPIPWLAERWEWGDGNQSVTMTLRDDVRWSDGSPVTANDVAFSFLAYRDDINSAVANLFTSLDSVEVVDDRNVRFVLTAPDGNWLLNASSQFVFSEQQYGDYWNGQPEGQRTLSGFDWGSNAPIGSGPWKVTDQGSDRFAFAHNEKYWRTPPAFERLEFLFSGSQEERVGRWVSGEGDLLWPVTPLDIPYLKDTPARLFAARGANVSFAAFNFENLARDTFPQMLTDSRIRQALTLAIDRDRYASELYLDLIDQLAAGTIAQPWATDPSVTNPKTDLTKAKALLAEAGFLDFDGDGLLEDPAGMPFTLTAIVPDNANPMLIEILNGLVEDYAALGAALTVSVLSPDAFFDTWTNTRAFDFIAYSYALYPGFTDYDLYGSNWDIRINPQGWNPGGYDNDDVDSYIKKILISPNLKSQGKLLDQLQQTVNDDLFGLWFGFPDELVLARNDIQGFQPNKYLPPIDTRLLWRDEDGSGPVFPEASPVASPIASPSAATPIPSSPVAATSVASPVPNS